MHLGPNDLLHQIGLASMRHKELREAAQRQRLIAQAQAGQRAARSAPVWRRLLGEQLVMWGEALQAPSPRYPRSAAHNRAK